MKFCDGAWLMQQGVKGYYTSEVRSYSITENEVVIYAPFSPIRHRGDTLTGPLFTISITSPYEDVIKLNLMHFKQKKKAPSYELTMNPLPLKVDDQEDKLAITTGNTTVIISKQEFKIEYFFKANLITSSTGRSLGMMQIDEKDTYMVEALNLAVNEKIYGLGERFSEYVKNGQSIEMWNRDGGTGTEQSYKNIPFYLSSKGYGLLVNDSNKVSFEVASEKVSKIQFSTPGESLEYLFFPGENPKEVLKKYTAISGLPTMPPAWSFGLWLTTSFTTNYDEQTVTSFIDGMAERNLPLHTFHFDCFWMKEYEWCNFQWDDAVFPDPENMLKRLKAKGLHICVWINPYIGQKSPLYDEGLEHGYFIKTTSGDTWQWDLWQPGMAIVDFTNPAATKWYLDYLEALLDMGVDCFKTDFGERIPTENVCYFDGSDPDKMHNYYAYLYNKVVFELLERKLGTGKACLFARSASVGSQKFPVHWGGDCTSQFESMAESLRGGLSLCMSGFGFWSHDIGGFENTSTSDVYKRWLAFGLLSSHSRLHGSQSYRVPWAYDEESVDVCRHFTNLKCRLMPYMYTQAILTTKTGTPMMRSMFLEYPEDLTCRTLDLQYFLGDSLLVSPIFNDAGHSDYYIPEGTFTHLLSNETKEGCSYYSEDFDYFSLPLFVKPNTILPLGNNDQRPDYDYLDQVEYHVFALDDTVTINLPVYNVENECEETISLEKTGTSIQVSRQSSKEASIILRGISAISSSNVPYETTDLGVKLTIASSTQKIEITL